MTRMTKFKAVLCILVPVLAMLLDVGEDWYVAHKWEYCGVRSSEHVTQVDGKYFAYCRGSEKDPSKWRPLSADDAQKAATFAHIDITLWILGSAFSVATVILVAYLVLLLWRKASTDSLTDLRTKE